MAKQSYKEKEGVKAMPWSTFFTRTADIPLDRSSIFDSYEDAEKYAKGLVSNPDSRNLVTVSYVGQIITVFENDEVNVYKISVNRTLEPLGEGKGVVIVNNKTEAKMIANKYDSIGKLIFDITNKIIYMVVESNILVKIFNLNTKNEVVYDGGEY